MQLLHIVQYYIWPKTTLNRTVYTSNYEEIDNERDMRSCSFWWYGSSASLWAKSVKVIPIFFKAIVLPEWPVRKALKAITTSFMRFLWPLHLDIDSSLYILTLRNPFQLWIPWERERERCLWVWDVRDLRSQSWMGETWEEKDDGI